MIVLGTGCKKESGLTGDSAAKTEPATTAEHHDHTTSTVNPNDGPGGNPGYPDTEGNFPHNTGLCNCGTFAGCHPQTYTLHYYDRLGFGHWMTYYTQPGQTTFPAGAHFPGNG